MNNIYPSNPIKHCLHVDSKGLSDKTTTLHDGKDYRLRQTVQGIRDSFESGELDSAVWTRETANIGDALKKRDARMHGILNEILSNGLSTLPQHSSFSLDSDTWK